MTKITKLLYDTLATFVIIRDTQISRLAKSQKIKKKLKKTVRNMFLNQIKHINMGFNSRTTREFW